MRRRGLLFALIFALGAVSGYSINSIRQQLRAKHVAAARKTADSAASIGRLTKKLHLSAKQRTEIAKIINARRRDVQALKSDFRPRYAVIRRSTKQDIQTVLDEQQKSRFRLMTEQAEKNYPWMQAEEAAPPQDDSSRPDGESPGLDDDSLT